MQFVWGVISVVFVVAITFVLAALKYQVADALYVLLSGAVVGAGFTLASLLRGGSAGKSVRLFFLALLGAVAAWALGQVLCRLTTVWLIGDAALAYDLLVGVIGSVTVGSAMLFTAQRDNPAG